MLLSNARMRRPSLLGPALAFAAIMGWSSFAYSALGSRQQVSILTSERDTAVVAYAKLQGAGGELAQIESRLAVARAEYEKVAQGTVEARARSGAVQQELASLTKRLDQARDRVSQTGSIRPAELPRKPAQKP
jgi:hypothetical protein